MKRHISILRRDAAQAKIKAKIKVLEQYAQKGIPEGSFIPRDLSSFRSWEDDALGLDKIGSPNTLDKPYNSKLKEQVLELIAQLAKNKKRKEGKTDNPDKLRAQVKKLSRLVKDLTSQLHTIRHDFDQARQSERRSKKRADDLDKENAVLCRKINTISGLTPVGGNSGNE